MEKSYYFDIYSISLRLPNGKTNELFNIKIYS